jgi:hypothetical protein
MRQQQEGCILGLKRAGGKIANLPMRAEKRPGFANGTQTTDGFGHA